ncbi:hypothetical protein [Paraburkholderia caffeinilytica]|uniref:DUF4276 family protein n=1 Tax=Paraburkholderia caffeinilytica TaxID=1761016 RepID=A0ABQ1MXU3_9BURK|nr:hypothetical protein [Paraburkholderia caffeinilytica]GGC48736.1 hypothetical protein GCM10011400_40120 [Paraburkholderia caffeinilytica]CAB3782343.1 hypothetical protein LMG28690_01318 [Paraburkholderia caffeinilytica]
MTGTVFVVGEDELCCAIADALIAHSGIAADIQQRIVAGGAGPFKQKILAMNNVARNVMPVLMIADADQAPCVVTQRNSWLPRDVSQRLSMRLAVKEAEAWVLADHIGFSKFAVVSKDLFPGNPEMEPDPKQALLALVKKSKRRELRDEMLPGKGATSPVGLGYNIHMTEFVKNHWNVGRAVDRAPSLARAIPRVAALLQDVAER